MMKSKKEIYKIQDKFEIFRITYKRYLKAY